MDPLELDKGELSYLRGASVFFSRGNLFLALIELHIKCIHVESKK